MKNNILISSISGSISAALTVLLINNFLLFCFLSYLAAGAVSVWKDRKFLHTVGDYFVIFAFWPLGVLNYLLDLIPSVKFRSPIVVDKCDK